MKEKKYTAERNTQILIYLMKEHGIRKVIVSPGTTNMNFVWSVENDDYFEVFNVVDERSAAYMACGMAEESGEPVAISCTQATAPRDYIPGMTEAYYRKLPVLAIASTHRMGHVGQNMPQVTDRTVLQKDAAVFHAVISVVHDEDDEWSCGVKINEALLALTHHGGGPVFLDVETGYSRDFSAKQLIPIKTIRRICSPENIPPLPDGTVAIYCGAHSIWSSELTAAVDEFCKKYNALVLCDHMSNYHGKYGILPTVIYNQENTQEPEMFELMIHIGNVCRKFYSPQAKTVWRVNPDGRVADTFRKLTYVMEMDELVFFKACNQAIDGSRNRMADSEDQYGMWKNKYNNIMRKIPELPVSSLWTAKHLAQTLPDNSVLYLCGAYISKCFSMYEFKNQVMSYANSGGCGIDGPMSSFIGASLARPEKLFFGIIGDLAFFYDMNCLGNKHIQNNVRIVLINNGCGMEMAQYVHPVAKIGGDACVNMASKGGHYSAKSVNLVRDYVSNLGFSYFRVETKKDFLDILPQLTGEEMTELPMFVEIITDDELENDALKKVYGAEGAERKMINPHPDKDNLIDVPGRLLLKENQLRIVLWGAGNYFTRYVDEVRSKASVSIVCDNNEALWGKDIAEGVTCVCPDELKKMKDIFVVLMVGDTGMGFAIANQLLDYGISDFDLVLNFLKYRDYSWLE